MISHLKLAIISSIFILISACGGGNSDGNNNSNNTENQTTNERSPVIPEYSPNSFAYEGTGIEALIESGLSGLGVDVCIIDTGLDTNHQAFKHLIARNAIKWADFTFENSPTPIDTNGHGTHVAGIIAMNDELTGGAPNVTLYIARTFTTDGGTDDRIIAQAVDWCRESMTDIISMSLGGLALPAIEALLEQDTTESEAAIQRALDIGIYVVAAAGNTEIARDVATPASMTGVIAVGALEQDLATKAVFSQSGINNGILFPSRNDPNKKPEVSAPGVGITSAIASDSVLANEIEACHDTEYCALNGTSQATPFVSAALALILEEKSYLQHEHFTGDPSEAIDLVISALIQSTSIIFGQSEPHDNGVGYGLINVDALNDAL